MGGGATAGGTGHTPPGFFAPRLDVISAQFVTAYPGFPRSHRIQGTRLFRVPGRTIFTAATQQIGGCCLAVNMS